MGDPAALRVAVDLVHMPSLARQLRRTALPGDVEVLLRILAGHDELLAAASEVAGRSPKLLREAAAFFVEQVMLHPDADSYRVLGTGPHATNGDLRRNMALLLTWLHPDLARQSDRRVLVQRVTRAWEDLKTPERRAVYDAATAGSRSKANRSRVRRHAAGKRPPQPHGPERMAARGDTANAWIGGAALLRRGWVRLLTGAKR